LWLSGLVKYNNRISLCIVMACLIGFLSKIRHQSRGININNLANKGMVEFKLKGRRGYNSRLGWNIKLLRDD